MTNIIATLQNQFGDFFMQIFGNPIYMGIVLVLIFFVWVMVSGMKTDGKILILVGAFFLGFAFLPAWLQIIMGILAGVMLGLAILKVLNK